ncbi:hypothetical protein L1S35_05205 [Flavobacterium sp. AS60]|uniref:hypothetical protein n=1 Tax=Flavobacterium anseongense TaxID=2910677 RepID=UPI001F3BB751|nr:hypothetical protein [Flavobacterium sp. AS60]MCF6129062.1 hypothetical protein [Flavobacterium sp. AS60]
MMRTIYFIFTFFLFQNLNLFNTGKYSYSASHFYESIELKNDDTFIYSCHLNFSEYLVEGKYNILNDSLILNSYPQKERLIVVESKKGNSKNLTFEISTNQNNKFSYDLHVLMNDNTEMEFKNEWEKTKLKKHDIKGFYIIDKNGLKSPKYLVRDSSNNYFKIKVNPSRAFESESWPFIENKIKPRNFNGDFQNYYLEIR